MIKQKIVLIFLVVIKLFSFEVNTHQALTRCAITDSCANGYTQNLESFINHGGLRNQSYQNEIFESYNRKYIDYARTGEGFSDWGIAVSSNYLGIIEAGSVLEDAVYPVHDFAGDGRFNNHFYAEQFNSKRWCPLTPYMKTSKTLCYGYGTRTDNIDWVFNKNVTLSHNFQNQYGLTDALYYFSKAFQGSLAERRKYQAKLFVSLGHVVHMLQDLHSPAHCRDNSHAKGDYLEIYGRYNGGFNLRNGNFNVSNNPHITQAIRSRGRASSILNGTNYYTYEDFFKKEAKWVSNNFASESHLGFEDIDNQTGDGLVAGNGLDSSSLFGSNNPHPSRSETFEGSAIAGFRNWAYIYTEGNTVSNLVNGTIPSAYRRIGLVKHGLLFDSYHMIAPKYSWVSGGLSLRQTGLNQKPLEDTAVNVMPRAVASTQAFIDFFFRGQIDVTINTQGDVTIRNVSNASTLSDSRLATFRSGKFIFYKKIGNKNILFSTWVLGGDMPIGQSVTFNLGKRVFYNIPTGTKITVVYEGDIGANLGGNNSYGVGMKGLSVDVTTAPDIHRDVYTFSVNGRHETYPNRNNSVANFSFDVDIYKNGVRIRRDSLNNILKLAWYDGSAHFHNSSKHHFDIWCQGNQRLCSYLRRNVATDTTVGYENWVIDWTVFDYGIYVNHISLFIYNVRNQIANYYTGSYTYKSIGAKISNKTNEEKTDNWISKFKSPPTNLYYISSEQIISNFSREDNASDDDVDTQIETPKKVQEIDLFDGMSEEEKKTMQEIQEEESQE